MHDVHINHLDLVTDNSASGCERTYVSLVHTHARLTALFPDYPGKLVPEG